MEAVRLLQLAVHSEKEPWWKPEHKDEEKILRVAMKSTNKEAIQIALGVINYRGEQGDFRWKDMIFKTGYS